MKEYKIENHAPSYLPEGEWKLVWADEFDGTELDRTKWDFRLNFWGKRFDAYTDQGVIVRDGCVELHRVEVDGRYVSPQLQTGSNSFDIPQEGTDNPWGEDKIWKLGILEEPKFVHRYGYYECRCKFQKDPQTMWSAFWTQSPTIGARFEPEWCGIESDIMEHFKIGEATSGNIMGGYGKQFREEGRVYYPIVEEGWHYFGMDWQPDGYVFYCDGKEVSRCSENVSHVPEFILLTTEVMGYRNSKKTKKIVDANGNEREVHSYDILNGFEDDAFICDFVRVFDRKK